MIRENLGSYWLVNMSYIEEQGVKMGNKGEQKEARGKEKRKWKKGKERQQRRNEEEEGGGKKKGNGAGPTGKKFSLG